ncbi:protein disulfide-isomerase [Orussus abietinus]|uniref:protein disulfide-isomerase n=1 Tax=Orussus abietinus TaxID=222816 RepID=UPI0006250B89|nr:protein disulfide-isomerase [Orussus abietinus]
MKLLALVNLVVAGAFLAAVFADDADDHVIIMTKDNFEKTLAEHEFVLIEFYAPWCGHCKALAPEYAKAAKELHEMGSNIKLAKVDATLETELAEKHGVKGYPTLKFYRSGAVREYGGGRKAEEIVDWLVRKTGPAAKDLPSVEEAKAFIEGNDVAVVGFFKDLESEGAKVFLETASTIDDHKFGLTNSEDVFAEYETTDGKIVLFKKFDDGKSVFDKELSIKNLKSFIAVQSLPILVEFGQDTAQKIFSGEIKSHLLFFLSKTAGHYDKYLSNLSEPAKKFRDEILFVTINSDNDDHERILDFFGIKKDDAPAMRIIQLEQDMAKYKPENPELSAESVLEFVTGFVEGKLKRHMLTQDLPEDWNKTPVTVLVGTNFHEVAFDKEKDVLVEFYAPWCGHCEMLAPIYESLGEKYKDNESIIIAKMDATANELEDIKIENFPTIVLYKKETNEAVNYIGERTLEGLSKFIETNGAYGQAPEEAQEEDEDDDVPRKDEL